MRINLQGKNIELTLAIEEYVNKRLGDLEKLLARMEDEEEAQVRVELSQTTKHHKQGMLFEADCSVRVKGEEFFASATEEDLYTAIDRVKESLFNEIGKHKDRKQTLLHRGARSVKKMLKGLSKRNPFTSKY